MKKLNEILGTEFPIIQGGMANIATGEFTADKPRKPADRAIRKAYANATAPQLAGRFM